MNTFSLFVVGCVRQRIRQHTPKHQQHSKRCCVYGPGRSLTEKKKEESVPVPVFPQKPAGTPCAQPWLVAVGGWRLAVGGWRLSAVGGWQLAVRGGWWRLVVVGGWWLVVGGGWQWLAVGGWPPLAVGGGWWLVAVGGWWFVVDGSWRLADGGPLGRSLRAVLSKKKKIWFLKDPPWYGHDQNLQVHHFDSRHAQKWSRQGE